MTLNRIVLTVLLTLGVIPSAGAVSEYDECANRVKKQYVFKNLSSDPLYKKIYEEKHSNAKAEYEKWLNNAVGVRDGKCNHVSYKCTNGQKNKDCVPEACWSLHDETSRNLIFKSNVEDEFIKQKTATECAGKSKEDKSTDTSASTDTKKSNARTNRTSNRGKTQSKVGDAKKKSDEAKKDDTPTTNTGNSRTVSGHLVGYYFNEINVSRSDCGKGGTIRVDGDGNFSQTVGSYKPGDTLYIQYKKLTGDNGCKEWELTENGKLGDIIINDKCETGQEPKKRAGKWKCVDTDETKAAQKDKAKQERYDKEQKKSEKDATKKADKEAECKEKHQVAEKKGLVYVCVDTDDTEKQNDADCKKEDPQKKAKKVAGIWRCVTDDAVANAVEKATNAMWDDLEILEGALTKRLSELAATDQ